MIAEIIRQAGGKFTGKTRLYKAFYIAHLLYAEQEPGYLTVWPIVRMPYGPGIDCGDELIAELESGAGVKSWRRRKSGSSSKPSILLTARPRPNLTQGQTPAKKAVKDAAKPRAGWDRKSWAE